MKEGVRQKEVRKEKGEIDRKIEIERQTLEDEDKSGGEVVIS